MSRYADLSRAELAVVVPEPVADGSVSSTAPGWLGASRPSGARRCSRSRSRSGRRPARSTRGGCRRRSATHRSNPGRATWSPSSRACRLDIGAPPQFMDFRYTVHDPWRGEFRLDHCGALMDVEPMGEDYVRGMCHDIEDPTFDATAIASNPHAQVRPIHRPPRSAEQRAADRHPHCAWTVVIDDAHPEPEPVPALAVVERSRAATLALAPIDASDEGRADYTGPLLSDLDLAAFSQSALVRIADEVCLQMHLLDRSFALAVAERTETDAESAEACAASDSSASPASAPSGWPARWTCTRSTRSRARCGCWPCTPCSTPPSTSTRSSPATSSVVRPGPADEDGAWISLCGPDWTAALQAVVHGLDPHLDVEVSPLADEAGWRALVVRRDEAAPEAPEVEVVRFSTGAAFEFQPRRSLPISPV
ncbi:hypothetical protein [Nocardioides convexus]|uniref:hypothetical protein n=1 Tax=Nocardioides convexus TaxID=2712224 RepID=UPI0024181CB3|nr:hypothetical protein [Nocardioides convexus]